MTDRPPIPSPEAVDMAVALISADITLRRLAARSYRTQGGGDHEKAYSMARAEKAEADAADLETVRSHLLALHASEGAQRKKILSAGRSSNCNGNPSDCNGNEAEETR